MYYEIADSALQIYLLYLQRSEPEFVDLPRSPGIDSQPGGPVRQPYLTYWPGRLQRLTESIPWNRLLGSLNVNKFRLCLKASHLFRLEWPGRQKRRKSSKGQYNYQSETRSKREKIQIGGILPATVPARTGGEGRPRKTIVCIYY